ncbi:hypothetical protein ABZW18_34605, partial [Streptomyces sp. NPDC004647]|uniref:hypothetical protein n=1 Tax=Streptomyces sp. NPDC004647 TaxID=3154671 RepID=UPI0033A9B2D5
MIPNRPEPTASPDPNGDADQQQSGQRALSILDRAVSMASRRSRNFAPDSLAVTLHAPAGVLALDARSRGGVSRPAPGFPDLPLPVYAVTPRDLAGFTGLL